MESENAKSLDIYGVVIDQNGEPVAGAKIRGAIGYNNGPVSSSGVFRYTESDSQGRFNFQGIHGAGIGIWPTKDGYYYNPKLPSTTRPDDLLPDPNNPIVFKMWKLRGKEPLVSSSMQFTIPFDGTTTALDLVAQKQDANGEVRVVMVRSPSQVKRSGQKFDWNIKIEMVQGGVMAIGDAYPYWAPENGYVPSFQLNVSSNDVPWRSTMTQDFYIKNSQGHFGRLRIIVHAALTPVRIKFDFWLNQSGSQNLETDLSK